LDYMDPFSGFVAKTKQADVSAAMDAWPMRHLLDPTTRTRIAQLIAADLAYLLHPRNSGSANSWKRDVGGRSAYKGIDAGIISGIKKIKDSMDSRRKSGKLNGLGIYLLSQLQEAKL